VRRDWAFVALAAVAAGLLAFLDFAHEPRN
jgi:hypothetical protein